MEFPRWFYHRDGREVLVQSPEQIEQMGTADWYTSPVAQLSRGVFEALKAETARLKVVLPKEKPPARPAAPKALASERECICTYCGETGHTVKTCIAYKESIS